MRVYVKLLLLCIFIILCCAPCQAAYFLGLVRTDCEDLDYGCVFFMLENLSADGSVAVGHAWSQTEGLRPSTWSRNFGWPINYLPVSGEATAASANGHIIVGDHSYDQTILWNLNYGGGVPSYLWHVQDSHASDVSGNGSVVVGSASGLAVRWTKSTGLEYLGNLPGASESEASAISGDGSTIVGYIGDQAFRWTESEGMQQLKLMRLFPNIGVYGSKAYDVSTNGSVIVGYATSGRFPFQKKEAFRYTRMRIMGSSAYTENVTKLGHLPGTSESCAYGVSGNGSIVVGQSGNHAFIWDNTNGMRKLADVLVDEYGLDLKGWDLKKAKAISADGQTIIGDDWIADISDDCPPYEFGANACTKACPCDAGQGICHSNAECDPGLVCVEKLHAPLSWKVCELPDKTP